MGGREKRTFQIKQALNCPLWLEGPNCVQKTGQKRAKPVESLGLEFEVSGCHTKEFRHGQLDDEKCQIFRAGK